MSKMINIIMEALWDREFMSKHSLTGKKAPTDKTKNPAKPALPKEDVQAITSKSTMKTSKLQFLGFDFHFRFRGGILGNKTQVGNRSIHGSSLHHIQTTK
jgi:hypothetical protein